MSSIRRFDLVSKKVIIVVVLLAAGSIAAILIVAPWIAQATTANPQQQKRKMMWSGKGIPQINGSVSLANEIGHLNVIDARNGEVLYTSEGQPLGSFGHLSTYRHFGGHGHGRWSGPWKGQQ